ncbi:winged helix DNA-binding domain-containing protein [Aquihabitans sp. G128]|uniref:winged helix DNA-binding domain-containing protein n=1 Tax=Aquihabitans sp. G128 TaxID=2849779 RepID=UPI001C23875A|nr:winged helix DNA-binding domain-containing protein [Aquihabitans sp. G128]QXC59981.1 winged helix DNA-binding domain-containing protein [Aquihabitans sp. G128]
MVEALSPRALNRALLARQLLLERAAHDPVDVVRRLGGLQSQAPAPPYLGLAARIDGFDPEATSSLLADRALVRATTLRNTIHLHTAEDVLAWQPVLRPLAERFIGGQPNRRRLEAVADQLPEIVAAGASLLAEAPRTVQALGALLAERWPGIEPTALAHAARFLTPTVQPPPRGLWRTAGPAAFTTTEAWLGRAPTAEPDLDAFVLRYLAAFGPATAMDVQTWCGLTRLGPVLAHLRPQLATFTDERGRELFDLPEAPRPPAATEAPVRLVPEWDNLLLSHADRTRVISDEHRARIFTDNGIIHPTVLVDGVVAGRWRLERTARAASITLHPFTAWNDAAARQATAEAERLLATTDPAATHRVELHQPS